MNTVSCPCGSNLTFDNCCGIYLSGTAPAPTAEKLMRSRYTAYTLLNEAYLLATWHASTRPEALNLAQDTGKWLSLEVKRHQQQNADQATVEFVAKYKINGRAHQLHEVSRFVREGGLWFYVDGEVDEK